MTGLLGVPSLPVPESRHRAGGVSAAGTLVGPPGSPLTWIAPPRFPCFHPTHYSCVQHNGWQCCQNPSQATSLFYLNTSTTTSGPLSQGQSGPLQPHSCYHSPLWAFHSPHTNLHRVPGPVFFSFGLESVLQTPHLILPDLCSKISPFK